MARDTLSIIMKISDAAQKNALTRKILANNKNTTLPSAQMTRINYAQWIFDNNKGKEALSIIINSNRLDDVTKKKAREYFNCTTKSHV